MRPLMSTAPTRIDLAGGTLDLWPIHQLLDERVTVNIGITLNADVRIAVSEDGKYHLLSEDQNLRVSGSWNEVTAANHKLILPALLLRNVWSEDLLPVTLKMKAKSPAGAGLGGSSSLAMSILNVLFGARKAWYAEGFPSEAEMVAVAQDTEARIIHAPTGVQDYWGAVRGRLNILEFPAGRTKVTTIDVKHLTALADNLIVCYSGQARASALNNWQIFKRVFDGDKAFLAKFAEIGRLACQCAEALRSSDFDAAMQASQREWALRTSLWPDIETDQTKRLSQAAESAGATLSRVCGAGGGGVMAVFSPLEKRQAVIEALQKQGGQVLDAHIAHEGMRLVQG